MLLIYLAAVLKLKNTVRTTNFDKQLCVGPMLGLLDASYCNVNFKQLIYVHVYS